MSSSEFPYRCPTCCSPMGDQDQLACNTCGVSVPSSGRVVDFSPLTPPLKLGLNSTLQSVHEQISGAFSEDSGTPRIARQLAKIKSKAEGGLCVEIGSGAGPMTAELEHIFDRVVTIDHARPLVERTAQATQSAICILADAHFLPLADRCADFVVCTEVLEHVVIPTQVLLEIRRVLKAEGTAFITVPNEVGLNPFVVARPNAPRMDTHINYYNSKSLCRLLLSCGFQVIEMETCSPALGFRGWLRNPLRKFMMLLLKFPAFGSRVECLATPAEDPMACWQQLISRFSAPGR